MSSLVNPLNLPDILLTSFNINKRSLNQSTCFYKKHLKFLQNDYQLSFINTRMLFSFRFSLKFDLIIKKMDKNNTKSFKNYFNKNKNSVIHDDVQRDCQNHRYQSLKIKIPIKTSHQRHKPISQTFCCLQNF